MDDVAFVDVYIEFGVWFQSIFYLNIYYNKFFKIFFFILVQQNDLKILKTY
jgi:hypothetical protein